jgi:hypothetical protein
VQRIWEQPGGTYEYVRKHIIENVLRTIWNTLGTESGHQKHVHECKMDENVCNLGYTIDLFLTCSATTTSNMPVKGEVGFSLITAA